MVTIGIAHSELWERNMKASVALTASIVAIMLFALGHISARNQKRLDDQTLQNLSVAMHREAFAYAKYLLYAEHARQTGDIELDDLMEQAAKTERFAHFAEEAQVSGLVGSNSANLKDAVRSEFYESETMYREFAQQAEEAGDHEVALRFKEIGEDEAKHRDAFDAALVSRLERNGYPGNR